MKAEQLRKSILQLAIQGKLVPQDPNDEPASVLLERVRDEKQRFIKQGKIKKDKGDSVIFKGDDNCYYEKIGKEIVCIDEEVAEFDIPDGWSWTRLNSFCVTVFSGKSPKYSKEPTPHKVIGQQANQWDGVNLQYVKYCTDDFVCDMPELYYLQDGDVLLNTLGNGTLGRSGIFHNINEQNKILTDGHLFVFRNLNLALSKYLLLYLRTKYDEIVKSANGSTNQTFLSLGRTLQWLIPVPPISEVERIVCELEKYEPLINEYEQIETKKSKLDSEIYDKLKKSILQYAIQGKLVPQDSNDEPAAVLLERIRAEKKAQLGKKYVESYINKGDDNCYYEKVGKNEPVKLEDLPFDIPDTWAWARLGDIGDWGAGATPSRENSDYYGGNIPWIKTGELNNGYIFGSEETITQKALNECSLRYNKKGDVLIAMYGATIGKLAIAGIDLTTNQACCACTPYFGINNLYLFYLLMAEKDRFIKLGAGGAQPNISREKIVNYIVPIPPYKEQLKIVAAVKQTIKRIEKDES